MQIYVEAESNANSFANCRSVNSINGAIAANIRRSREQCKLVCKLPRRNSINGAIAANIRRSREQSKCFCYAEAEKPVTGNGKGMAPLKSHPLYRKSRQPLKVLFRVLSCNHEKMMKDERIRATTASAPTLLTVSRRNSLIIQQQFNDYQSNNTQ